MHVQTLRLVMPDEGAPELRLAELVASQTRHAEELKLMVEAEAARSAAAFRVIQAALAEVRSALVELHGQLSGTPEEAVDQHG